MTHTHRAKLTGSKPSDTVIFTECLGDGDREDMRWTDSNGHVWSEATGSWPGCPLRGEHDAILVRALAGGHYERMPEDAVI